MLNVLPFLAGLIAGAAAVSALRGERARAIVQDTGARLRTAYDEAGSGVRAAARSGFDLLRGLKPAPVETPEETPAAQSAVPDEAARKPAARRSAAAEPGAAGAVASRPRTVRAPRKAKPERTEV